MGKRGPKPTPTAIKKARGTDRADRRPGGDEPAPSRSAPRKIPDDVVAHPVALRTWRSLSPTLRAMGLWSSSDVLAFTHLCLAQADYEDAQAEVRKRGRILVGGHGGPVANPAVLMARQSRMQVHRLLSEFGLTPAARTRVRGSGDTGNKPPHTNKNTPPDPKTDPDGFLFGKQSGVVGNIGHSRSTA